MNNAPASRLKNFPISWFATIMGLSGFTIAWRRAEQLFSLPFAISPALQWLTVALFVLLAFVYLVKWLRYPGEVRAEIDHPVKLAFVPTVSIALILLSIVFLHPLPALARGLWLIGAIAHFAATLFVLNSWIHHDKYQIAHLNPAWFIPVVGNILVPVAGVPLGFGEVSWFFFALGLFFWPVLTAILFYRLIFHGSLPERLAPTLFIFIAPPAVGFISWHVLVAGIDAFARLLYGVALFFTLLLFSQIGRFARLKFFLSWWAYSFPLAAVTIASLIMAKETAAPLHTAIAGVLLAILTAVIVMLVVRTGMAVARQEICVEGH